MKLARYNEIVVALSGTAFLLGVVALGGFLFVESLGSAPQRGVVVNRSSTKRPSQNLVFCPSLTDATGAFQYIPVAVVVAEDSSRDAVLSSSKVASYSSSGFDDCAMNRYGGSSRTFNVIVRNLSSNGQRLLISSPGQIASFTLPTDKCAAGEGETPCGVILWKIRSADTTHDGTINGDDALVAYVSGLSAENLTAVTPADATLLDAQWVRKTETWQFQVRRDSSGDGKYTEEDGSDLVETPTGAPSLAKPFLQDSVKKALDAAVK